MPQTSDKYKVHWNSCRSSEQYNSPQPCQAGVSHHQTTLALSINIINNTTECALCTPYNCRPTFSSAFLQCLGHQWLSGRRLMCHFRTVLCGRWMPANDWASLQVLQAMEQICFHQRWPHLRCRKCSYFWLIGFDLSESFKQQLGFTVQTLHLQLQRHRVNETTTAGAGSNLFCHVSSVNSQPTSQSCLEKLSCEPLDDYQNVVSQTEVPPDPMHPMLPFPQTNFVHSDGQPPWRVPNRRDRKRTQKVQNPLEGWQHVPFSQKWSQAADCKKIIENEKRLEENANQFYWSLNVCFADQ